MWYLLFFLLQNFGFTNESNFIDPKIYENRYGKYYVPLNHNRPATIAIKSGEVYELETLEFIQKNYKKGTSIIHAGTYFGDMLPFFSKLVGNQKVFAFEPVHTSYLCAKKNIELNHLQNVDLFNLALSEKSSQLTMRIKDKSGTSYGGGSHMISDETFYDSLHDEPEDHFIKIEALSIDYILQNCNETISLIHLDVEGHEISALKGAKNTIEAYHPLLIVESWESKSTEINDYMESIGYKKIATMNGNDLFY